MLNILKKTTFTHLATPILVITSGMVLQQPAHASTQFCNQTDSQLTLAYAREEVLYSKDGGQTGTSTGGDDASVNISGWWNIPPGQCQTPNTSTGSAVAYCGANKYCYDVYQYFYAYESDGTYWAGAPQFCVNPNAAFNFNQFFGFGPSQSCPLNYLEKGFRPINATAPDFTLSLTK